MNAQILINCGTNWFEFSKSKTGQLDDVGKVENAVPDVKKYQIFASSTYFTPSDYVYIARELNYNCKLYITPDLQITDADTFSYLLHIGPLLSAVEANDSLLAGELYLRRRITFEKFSQLTQYLLNKLSVEIAFSLIYGKSDNINPQQIELIYESAIEKMKYDSSKENLEQAFMRYFKENNVKLSLPLVGINFYDWVENINPSVLEKLADNLDCNDILGNIQKIRNAKQQFYESLETVLQAEPYNQHDKNSIICFIEDVQAKINGNCSLKKAGHIRATAAAIIREAKPKKMSFDANLMRLNYDSVVLSLEV